MPVSRSRLGTPARPCARGETTSRRTGGSRATCGIRGHRRSLAAGAGKESLEMTEEGTAPPGILRARPVELRNLIMVAQLIGRVRRSARGRGMHYTWISQRDDGSTGGTRCFEGRWLDSSAPGYLFRTQGIGTVRYASKAARSASPRGAVEEAPFQRTSCRERHCADRVVARASELEVGRKIERLSSEGLERRHGRGFRGV